MSIEQAKAFLQELAGSEEMKEKLISCSTVEERMTFAKESGFEFTAEELSEARCGLFDEELSAISGSTCFGQTHEIGCGYTCEADCPCETYKDI
ncbi:MAG: Nif11-like leader peptide family natural product precursor [Chlorobiales bacterium]|nr:Nif11-like leader peptide family natural product precursor [Chlorobiales bacterium]